MNGFTFSPALGWVAGGLLAAGLAVLAILEIVLFVRRRASSDETVWACIRRTLMLLIVAVMVLTPSVVSSTTSQAINATDVIVAVDTRMRRPSIIGPTRWRWKPHPCRRAPVWMLRSINCC